MIRLSSDSSTSSAGPAPPRFTVVGSFVPVRCLVGVGMGVLEEEDMVTLLPVVSGTVSSRQMSEVVSACEAEHEDSPFCLSIGLSFSFGMFRWMGFPMYFLF